jgi:hypothetical protein
MDDIKPTGNEPREIWAVFCWGSRECLAVGGVLGADVGVAIGVKG